MKSLTILILSILLLTACQQENKETTNKSEAAQTKQLASTEQTVEASEAIETTKTEVTDPEHQAHEQTNDHGHEHPASDTPLVATGERFQVVEPQMECEEPVVIEFYAYHCPHCNHLEPAAEAWREKNAGKVKFVSIPTDLGHKQMGSLLLVHHAAKALGILEKTQHALFNRFHNEKKLFASPDEAAQFLADQGADLEKAKAALADQEALSNSMNSDFTLLSKYKISSVPQVLVNHQYITNITSAGGVDEVFKTVDEMLKLESSCKAK